MCELVRQITELVLSRTEKKGMYASADSYTFIRLPKHHDDVIDEDWLYHLRKDVAQGETCWHQIAARIDIQGWF